MNRIHFFEIEDQHWCPKVLRDGVTDFLQHIVQSYHLYQPITQRLVKALDQSGQNLIVDLCSGGAGPWLSLWKDVLQQSDNRILSVTLTDLYPNLDAFRAAHTQNIGIVFCTESINATQVPREIKGFRTFFSSFHHLKPEEAKAVLRDAVDAKTGIAIFESTQRHPLLLLYMLLTPFLVWLNTPFIRPWRWNRVFYTYIVPLIPFIVMFDGIVSCLRTYTPEELKTMVNSISAPYYKWDIGLQRFGILPIGITYMVGYMQKNKVN